MKREGRDKKIDIITLVTESVASYSQAPLNNLASNQILVRIIKNMSLKVNYLQFFLLIEALNEITKTECFNK